MNFYVGMELEASFPSIPDLVYLYTVTRIEKAKNNWQQVWMTRQRIDIPGRPSVLLFMGWAHNLRTFFLKDTKTLTLRPPPCERFSL